MVAAMQRLGELKRELSPLALCFFTATSPLMTRSSKTAAYYSSEVSPKTLWYRHIGFQSTLVETPPKWADRLHLMREADKVGAISFGLNAASFAASISPFGPMVAVFSEALMRAAARDVTKLRNESKSHPAPSPDESNHPYLRTRVEVISPEAGRCRHFRNFRATCGALPTDTLDMELILALHDLSSTHVVLGLHERLTWPGRGLEMHLKVSRDGFGAVAWWQDDRGEYCRMVEVARRSLQTH